jgi:hypothetical protein
MIIDECSVPPDGSRFILNQLLISFLLLTSYRAHRSYFKLDLKLHFSYDRIILMGGHKTGATLCTHPIEPCRRGVRPAEINEIIPEIIILP